MKRINKPAPKPAFVPFSLEIETLEEATLIAELLGAVGYDIAEALNLQGLSAYKMYDLVNEYADPHAILKITVI